MPVAGISNYPLVPLTSQRSGAAERVPRDTLRTEDERSEAYGQSPVRSSESQEELQIASPSQRVRSAKPSVETFSRRQAETENLSFSAQKALKTFADNSPSPEQRLGIELAGIDTYA